MRLKPDDDVYRINAVWLGPRGLTLPWVARYSAYAIWLVFFLTILLVEGLTPLKVGIPPVWEFALSVLGTYAVMGFVDHERPVRSLAELAVVEVTSPRKVTELQRGRLHFGSVRVRSRGSHGASKEPT
jgi:hypothetical protein